MSRVLCKVRLTTTIICRNIGVVCRILQVQRNMSIVLSHFTLGLRPKTHCCTVSYVQHFAENVLWTYYSISRSSVKTIKCVGICKQGIRLHPSLHSTDKAFVAMTQCIILNTSKPSWCRVDQIAHLLAREEIKADTTAYTPKPCFCTN